MHFIVVLTEANEKQKKNDMLTSFGEGNTKTKT